MYFKKHLMAVFLLLISLCGYTQNIEKYQSIMILNFFNYIELPTYDPKIYIGVIGNSKVLTELDHLISERHVDKYCVKRVKSFEEIKKYHVIFLPASQNHIFDKLLKLSEGTSLLIITENEECVKKGAGIGFYQEGNKLKFAINKGALKNRNIKVLNKLITLAKVY